MKRRDGVRDGYATFLYDMYLSCSCKLVTNVSDTKSEKSTFECAFIPRLTNKAF